MVAEPPIVKSQVAAFVPKRLRGPRFDTHVTGQAAWEDTPLYLWDVWNATINGATSAIELAEQGRRRKKQNPIASVLEMTVYAIALAETVEVRAPRWFSANQQFVEFLAHNLDRVTSLRHRARALGWDDTPAFGRLCGHVVGASLRAFVARTFGEPFAQRALLRGSANATEDVDESLTRAQIAIAPSPGDADGDGIADRQDRCGQTPLATRVWETGPWMGCAGGEYVNGPRP